MRSDTLSDLSSRRRVYMRRKKSIDCMRLGAPTHSFQLHRRVLANNNLLHHYNVNKKMRRPMADTHYILLLINVLLRENLYIAQSINKVSKHICVTV